MRHLRWLEHLLTGCAVVTLIFFLVNVGDPTSDWEQKVQNGLTYTLIGLFLVFLALHLWRLTKEPEYLERRLFDLAILIPLVVTRGSPQISASLIIFRQAIVWIFRFVRQRRVLEFLDSLQKYPARLLVSSFLAMVLVGTVLLALPLASETGQGLSLIDAFFMATSATCVTGLVVVDTATQFSLFGEIVILVLIQAGGLGIMALSASAITLLGKRLAVGQRAMMQSLFEQSDYEQLKKTIVAIIRFTFITELIGAIILTVRFFPLTDSLLQAAYYGVFHAISAFCNAGFALWNDSLVQFVSDPIVNLTMTTLIILGGLGFIVIGSLMSLPELISKKQRNPFRLMSIHSRLVLLMTVFLLSGATIFFFFAEFNHAFDDLSLGGKLWASFFHATTARTAGFNTIDMTSFQMSSLFFFTLLMFVGASPGSTGGGIKTTTLAMLALTARSMIWKRKDVEYGGRRIPEVLITKAIAIFSLSLVIIPIAILILSLTEEASFQAILFEVISAFGTVGLSLGLTPKLTLIGKLSITVLMFIGRLGPLTVALIAGEGEETASFRYPKGEIIIG